MIENIEKEFFKDLRKTKNLEELKKIETKYLGKKGKIRSAFLEIKNLPLEERKKFGQKVNLLKEKIEKEIEKKLKDLKGALLKKEKIDVTLPSKKPKIGHLHPLSKTLFEIEEIFERLGFEIVLGPEIENEIYNFDALNIPPNHPARDLWSTLWLKKEGKVDHKKCKMLLRTHTSPVQIRYMLKNRPPIRIVAPGRVFRHERTDASHEIQFHQLEGLMVDEKTSFAHFKAIIKKFFENFFKKRVKIRIRPSFFPFTEPSFEIDISKKEGEWLEVAGAGMVHPKVLLFCKINPKFYQGFAFGFGIDRLCMIKYGIKDIRLFYQNDLRFLRQEKV